MNKLCRCKICKDNTISNIICGKEYICAECFGEIVYGKITNQNFHICGNLYPDKLPGHFNGSYDNLVKTLENSKCMR